ncbi:hypothetical protein B0H11DRAFT_593185 [Mycena galericulata]|nr:hypothetical protein B0H11DRAFT_593185 [Mycena galericulata]
MAKKKIGNKIPPATQASTGTNLQSKEAEALKDAGNILFKAGKFREASAKYSQAAELAPLVATYPGNLSAALTEDGQYLEAIRAIRRAEAILTTGTSPGSPEALLSRLSARLAQCLYRAAQDNLLDAEFLSDHEMLIESLRSIPDSLAKTKWWDQYDRVYFDALPVRKSALNTSLEFFTVGHDGFHSLLQGILDGWGPKTEQTCSGDKDILLDEIQSENQRELSFLFGGVGDARHVFSTFLDICAQAPDPHVGVHFTLLDIQPAALARDLIMLLIFWKTPLSSDQYDLRLLSAKTAFYIFTCWAMPPDSHALLLKICRDLRKALDGTGPSLPPFISIDPGLVPAILKCLSFWIDLPSTITASQVLRHVQVESTAPLPRTSNQSIIREREVYLSLKVLLPPYTDAFQAAHDQVEFGTRNPLSGVFQYIEKNWKPNPTLFDKANYELYQQGNYAQYFTKLHFDPNRQVISALDHLFTRLDDLGMMKNNCGTDPRWPSFSTVHDILFAPMVNALKLWSTQIRFEFLAGDLVQFLALLKCSSPALDWRRGFPISFTRAWMSNVPDYTGGLLEMALYAVPCLQQSDIASVGMNCLFNGPIWNSNFENFVFTYTMLVPYQLPQYLGCTVRWYQNVPSILHQPFALLPCQLPLKNDQLAPREQVVGWLHRILMRILAPPYSNTSGYSILMPTTFRTFIQLLIHVVDIGYPSNWISDLLNSILSDDVHSSWRPYLTAPMSADTINIQYPSTKIQLSSWMADIEVVIASALPILPRDVEFLSEPMCIAETAVFRTTVAEVFTRQSYSRNPGLALVFSAPGFDPHQSTFKTHSLLFSKTKTGADVQIVFSILTCDVDANQRVGTVSWRMSIPRYEKMKQDRWGLYLWQADEPFIASKISVASEWKRI